MRSNLGDGSCSHKSTLKFLSITEQTSPAERQLLCLRAYACLYINIYFYTYTQTHTQTHFWREILCLKQKKTSCLTINTILKCHLQLPRSQICRTAALSQLYFAGMPRQVVNALLPPNDVSRDCPFPKPPFSYSTTRLKNK